MKKVNATCLLLLLLGSSIPCLSQGKIQSVVAAAGDISTVGTISLEWTVGEPVVETASNLTHLYTQGFHQPVLSIKRLTKEEGILTTKNAIRVYPNPTTALINIRWDLFVPFPLQALLVDMNGKTLINLTIPSGTVGQQIDISRFSKGTYLLRLVDGHGLSQGEFKIVKIN